MNKINLRPALKSKSSDMLKTLLIFFAIMAVIILAIAIVVRVEIGGSNTASGTFSVFYFAAAVTMFVMGISSIREELRMNIQFGVGRLTTFAVMVITTVAFSIALSIAGEIITAIGTAIVGNTNYEVLDIFAQLYAADKGGVLTLGEHLMSALCTSSILILGYFCGAFLSLMFYRLSKPFKILVAVGGAALIWIILPILAAVTKVGMWLTARAMDVIKFMIESPWNFILVFIICSVIAAALDWLLIRRAPVKAAKG